VSPLGLLIIAVDLCVVVVVAVRRPKQAGTDLRTRQAMEMMHVSVCLSVGRLMGS
jgi:hypothetical protein